MTVKAELIDTWTGVWDIHTYKIAYKDVTWEGIEFLWEEGNFACDCNRIDFLYDEWPEDYPCNRDENRIELLSLTITE